MSSLADTEVVGYPLHPFEVRLAELERAGHRNPAHLAFFARFGGHRTHQFYLDRFTKLRGSGPHSSLLLAAEATTDGHRSAAHNYLTHGLHSYKGKYFPQVVRSLLNAHGISPPASVVDPFVGSGTTSLEAALMASTAHGIDRNPLAALIAQTKVGALALDGAAVPDVAMEIRLRIERSNPLDLPNMAYLERWFPPETLKMIAAILAGIDDAQPPAAMRDVARLNLSSLLRGWSLQEPSQLRIFRRKQAPPAEALRERFLATLDDTSQGIRLGIRLIEELGISVGSVCIVQGDARQASSWGSGEFDALVTSPPYATALPYIDTDRLSIYTLGLDSVGARSELEWAMIGNREIRKRQRTELEAALEENAADLPQGIVADVAEIKRRNEAVGVGFRRENLPALLYRYFSDMRSVLERAAERLKPAALCAIVVGDSYTVAGGERFQVRTADFLCDIALALGFSIDERIEMGGQAAYLPHQRNGIPGEEILLLRAPRRVQA